MANNKVKFIRGTTEEYQALSVKDPDVLYIITDESENSDIINDTLISQTTTWSSQKIHDSLNDVVDEAKTYADGLAENTAAKNHTHTVSEITDFPEIPELPTPTSFSVESAAWTTLSAPFTGCGFSAEIAAEGVTAADFPDVYFDSTSLEIAANSSIIAEATDGKIVLYAKNIPQAALSGSYFIRKGATE